MPQRESGSIFYQGAVRKDATRQKGNEKYSFAGHTLSNCFSLSKWRTKTTANRNRISVVYSPFDLSANVHYISSAGQGIVFANSNSLAQRMIINTTQPNINGSVKVNHKGLTLNDPFRVRLSMPL